MSNIEHRKCESCFEPIDAGVFFVGEDGIHLTLCLECYRALGEAADV